MSDRIFSTGRGCCERDRNYPPEFFCQIHGDNSNHDTSDCIVLRKEFVMLYPEFMEYRRRRQGAAAPIGGRGSGRGMNAGQASDTNTFARCCERTGDKFHDPSPMAKNRPFQGFVRYGTGILGTGMDVVPNLPKCPVPVLMSYLTYRGVRYRY